MKRRIGMWAVLFAVLAVSTGSSNAASTIGGTSSGADNRVKQIDRRTMSEEDRYFIVFCARGDSATGHAFVVLGHDDEQAATCSQKGFGLYPDPKQGLKSVLATVPGEIMDEVLKGSLAATTHRLIVEVDSAQYRKALAIRDEWAARGEYKLVLRDCVTFTQAVAKTIGLDLPSRSGLDNLPERYIRALMDAND